MQIEWRTEQILLEESDLGLHSLLSPTCISTVKPAYVVTSIEGSPVLNSHLFWVP